MGTRDGRGVTLLSMPTPGRIDSELVYDGRVVRLSVDTVRFPDGSEGQVEMIRHAGASAVLPFLGGLLDPDPDVILVRQVPVRVRRLSLRSTGWLAGRARGELGGMRASGTRRRNRHAGGNHDPAHTHRILHRALRTR